MKGLKMEVMVSKFKTVSNFNICTPGNQARHESVNHIKTQPYKSFKSLSNEIVENTPPEN